MPIIATDTPRYSNVVKHEYAPETGYTRLVVTVNEATAKTYVAGTVLGKVTANGKYMISVQTAVDGSQTADAIVLGDATIPATTDTKVLVLVRGPAIVAKSELVLDATHNTGPELAAIYAALEAKGILVNDSI